MTANRPPPRRLYYPNALVWIWVVSIFVAFGVVSNFVDRQGVLYNLLQGMVIAAFAGAVLFFVRSLGRGPKPSAGTVSRAAEFLMPEAGHDVVVDHARRLHECVADGRAHELEPALGQVGAERVRL